MSNMGDDGSWRTPPFRQAVVSKIEEAIRRSGVSASCNSLEMENLIFQKAKTKDEYLGYAVRLILHVREMKTKKGAGMGMGVPDLINALQTLEIQGNSNPLMTMGGQQQGPMGPQQQITATNLLQNLNQGPGQAMNNMQENIPPSPNMGIGPNSGPIPNQMSQMNAQLPNQIANQLADQIPNASINQIPNQLGNQMQGPVQNQMENQLPGQIQVGGPSANYQTSRDDDGRS